MSATMRGVVEEGSEPKRGVRHSALPVWRGIAGAIVGAVIGGIAALNIKIYAGTSQGYEASMKDLFEESPLAGGIAIVVIVAGTLFGGWIGMKGIRR